MSVAENGAEWAENRVQWAGAGVAENDGAGAERRAGGRGAGSGMIRPLTSPTFLLLLTELFSLGVYG